MLEIRTLGGLSMKQDGETLPPFDARKVEALLVYLACTGREHPRKTAAEFIWHERTQTQLMTSLRGALSSLRKHLGEFAAIAKN